MFKSEARNIFNTEVRKIALNSKDCKIIQLIDCKETYAYRTGENIIQENEKFK